jgi:hypothetical protein
MPQESLVVATPLSPGDSVPVVGTPLVREEDVLRYLLVMLKASRQTDGVKQMETEVLVRRSTESGPSRIGVKVTWEKNHKARCMMTNNLTNAQKIVLDKQIAYLEAVTELLRIFGVTMVRGGRYLSVNLFKRHTMTRPTCRASMLHTEMVAYTPLELGWALEDLAELYGTKIIEGDSGATASLSIAH